MFRKLSDTRILWALIALYALVFGIVASLRHYDFETQTWDLAIFVQTFWNAAHGNGLVNTIEQVPRHLGVHFSPFLYLLVPGYALFQSPYYLLIVQTLALALGAWPFFLLAKKILGEERRHWALGVAGAYLLYPPLHRVNLFDFHEAAFFIPFALAALYFLDARKWIWAGVFLAAAAMVKEDVILAVLFIGIFLLVKAQPLRPEDAPLRDSKHRIAGAVIVLTTLIYFFLVTNAFMPAFGGGLFRIDRYAMLGETPAAIVKNVVTNPLLLVKTIFTSAKVSYVFWLLFPFLFLPLLSPTSLVLLIPGLAENLLTSYPPQFSGLYHYDAMLIPALFVAAVYGLKNVLGRAPERKRCIGWVLTIAVLAGILFRSPIGPRFFPVDYFQTSQQEAAYRNLVKLAPPDVSVAAQTNLVPHLANRQTVHFAGFETELADMVLLDTEDRFGFPNDEDFAAYVDRYRGSGEYNSYIFDDRYVVLLNKKLGVLK